MDDIPYRFDVTDHAAALHEKFDSLEPGEESGTTVAVAGRVMLARGHGRLAFLVLRDRSGDMHFRRVGRRAFIKLHNHIGAKLPLDIHAPTRSKLLHAAVHMRLKDNLLVIYLSQVSQREHLK